MFFLKNCKICFRNNQENIVSATLMPLMQQHPKERIENELEFFRILEQAKLSEREIKFLYSFSTHI